MFGKDIQDELQPYIWDSGIDSIDSAIAAFAYQSE
jgi:hypothetical protein